MSLSTDFDEVFAEPGKGWIIDTVNRETGRSAINGQTLEEIQARYPDAVRVSFDDWRAARVAAQNTPIVWDEVSIEQYDEMLCVLPPAVMDGAGFLVGEPDDHSAETGAPRFRAYLAAFGKYYRSSRPVTVREWKARAFTVPS